MSPPAIRLGDGEVIGRGGEKGVRERRGKRQGEDMGKKVRGGEEEGEEEKKRKRRRHGRRVGEIGESAGENVWGGERGRGMVTPHKQGPASFYLFARCQNLTCGPLGDNGHHGRARVSSNPIEYTTREIFDKFFWFSCF